MRIANKNELSVLFADCYEAVCMFRLSDAGKLFNMMYNDNTNFDLDLDMVKSFLGQLLAGSIINQECVDRFNTFKIENPEVSVLPEGERRYKLTPPVEVVTISEYSDWLFPYCTFEELPAFSIAIVGEFIIKGTCNHPDAMEVV